MTPKTRDHSWRQDADTAWACCRVGCTVRRNPEGTAWQWKKGGHWRKVDRESIPTCVGQQSAVEPAATYRIKVYDGKGSRHADDSAPTEAEARQQAAGWTGQRGQMTWTATIYAPNGKALATYRRGKEVSGAVAAEPRTLSRICMKCGVPFSGPVETTLPHCPDCARDCPRCPTEAKPASVDGSAGFALLQQDAAPLPFARILQAVWHLRDTGNGVGVQKALDALDDALAIGSALPDLMQAWHERERHRDLPGPGRGHGRWDTCPDCRAKLEGKS